MRKFRKVAVGGTFDCFHKGHRKLLEKALKIGDLVIIGLTTDDMIKNTFKHHSVAKYKERKRNIVDFIKTHEALEKVQIVSLTDPYGITLIDDEIEAIVVSRETEKRAKEINQLREERGLKPLEVKVIDMVLSDDMIPISTTRIKLGEIDRGGHLLQNATCSQKRRKR